MESYFAGVITHKVKSFVDEPEGFPVPTIQRGSGDQLQPIDDFLQFNLAQAVVGIAGLNESAKVIQKQNILIFSVDTFTVDIGILLLLKQSNDGLFQLCFSELTLYECIVHADTSFTVNIGLPERSMTGSG